MTSQAAAELDLAIIGALQLNPRADWADVAEALQYSPKTLARRWKLLSESGSAWIAVAPGPTFLQFGCAAWLAITCRP
ncbi:MAG: AsnC family protein, partial [Rhodococcus sp. (in: high G+C Gram-positive bacteria)]